MFPRRLAKALSYLLMVAVLFASPLATSQAQAFPGVESVAMGSAAGGAAGIAAGALVGALGLGTAAFALPTLGLIGAAIGGIVTTMMGNDRGADTPKAIGYGALGAGLGAGALAGGGFLFSPWILIPAAAVGIGTLAFKYMQRQPQWGGNGDMRHNGTFQDPFFSASHRIANRSVTGAYGQEQTTLDKIRNIFDRNRRDDNFLGGSYQAADGTLRRRDDLFAQAGRFINGASYQDPYGGGYSFYGPGYGQAGYFSPGALPRTDRLGQVSYGGQGRGGFARAAGDAPLSLQAAQEARDQAYGALVEVLKPGATGDADAALEAFQAASQALEAAKAR